MTNGRHKGARRRIAWMAVLGVMILALLSASCYFLIGQPIESVQAGVQPLHIDPPTPTVTPTPSASTNIVLARECRAGWPTGFTWPDLGIANAPIEKIGAVKSGSGSVPGDPESKLAIGVFTGGGLPGQGHNIITDGHTYGDNSGIFKQDLDTFVKEGSLFWFTMDNGSACQYRVAKVFHQLERHLPVESGHELFSDVATREGFYDAGGSTERVVMMTCSGDMSDGYHHFETAWFATPVN